MERKRTVEIEEIEHLLLHALTEESVAERLDTAKSQQEVYTILSELPYFELSMEEFQQGIRAMQAEQADLHEHEE
jgi:hypothetical protein